MRYDRAVLCLLCVLAAGAVALAWTPDTRAALGTSQALEIGKSGGMIEPRPSVELTVAPSFVIENARHVANGEPLRNRASEGVQVSGVPVGREIVKALLYYNFSDLKEKGEPELPILFDGHKVIGELVADSADPCWKLTGNHTYRFDVTDLISAANPNREYAITTPFDLDTVTTGEDPWNTSVEPKVNNEGVTLIILYATDEPSMVLIYDELPDSMFFERARIELQHPMFSGMSLKGLLTMTGADGQTGRGHDTMVAGERGYLDSVQFSGPPVAPCDWDGSGRLPLSQLWDVHTRIVDLDGESSTIEYEANGDCLVPVAFVIETPVR
ncbi:MAG: DUF3344 domain-containing protein [Acidobacteria bacterium]|nr:MAG: DUF3344 domain-containing protein [Acidobacteriota bacterium]